MGRWSVAIVCVTFAYTWVTAHASGRESLDFPDVVTLGATDQLASADRQKESLTSANNGTPHLLKTQTHIEGVLYMPANLRSCIHLALGWQMRR